VLKNNQQIINNIKSCKSYLSDNHQIALCMNNYINGKVLLNAPLGCTGRINLITTYYTSDSDAIDYYGHGWYGGSYHIISTASNFLVSAYCAGQS